MTKKGKPSPKPKKRNRRALSKKQQGLLRNLRKGMPAAEAAIAAGYKCKNMASASSTVSITLKRLVGRPPFREALQARGGSIDLLADYVMAGLEGKEIIQVWSVAPDPTDATKQIRTLTEEVIRDNGRSRAQSLKWMMEAFEVSQPGEPENIWDGVSDEDLARIIAETPGDGLPGGPAA
jgi:hypothetical protein